MQVKLLHSVLLVVTVNLISLSEVELKRSPHPNDDFEINKKCGWQAPTVRKGSDSLKHLNLEQLHFDAIHNHSKYFLPSDWKVRTTPELAAQLCADAGLEPARIEANEGYLRIFNFYLKYDLSQEEDVTYNVATGSSEEDEENQMRIKYTRALQNLRFQAFELATKPYLEKGKECIGVRCKEWCSYRATDCSHDKVIPLCQLKKEQADCYAVNGQPPSLRRHQRRHLISLGKTSVRELHGSYAQASFRDALTYCDEKNLELLSFIKDNKAESAEVMKILRSYSKQISAPKSFENPTFLATSWTSGRFSSSFTKDGSFRWTSVNETWKSGDSVGHFKWYTDDVKQPEVEKCLVVASATDQVVRPVACYLPNFFVCATSRSRSSKARVAHRPKKMSHWMWQKHYYRHHLNQYPQKHSKKESSRKYQFAPSSSSSSEDEESTEEDDQETPPRSKGSRPPNFTRRRDRKGRSMDDGDVTQPGVNGPDGDKKDPSAQDIEYDDFYETSVVEDDKFFNIASNTDPYDFGQERSSKVDKPGKSDVTTKGPLQSTSSKPFEETTTIKADDMLLTTAGPHPDSSLSSTVKPEEITTYDPIMKPTEKSHTETEKDGSFTAHKPGESGERLDSKADDASSNLDKPNAEIDKTNSEAISASGGKGPELEESKRTDDGSSLQEEVLKTPDEEVYARAGDASTSTQLDKPEDGSGVSMKLGTAEEKPGDAVAADKGIVQDAIAALEKAEESDKDTDKKAGTAMQIEKPEEGSVMTTNQAAEYKPSHNIPADVVHADSGKVEEVIAAPDKPSDSDKEMDKKADEATAVQIEKPEEGSSTTLTHTTDDINIPGQASHIDQQKLSDGTIAPPDKPKESEEEIESNTDDASAAIDKTHEAVAVTSTSVKGVEETATAKSADDVVTTAVPIDTTDAGSVTTDMPKGRSLSQIHGRSFDGDASSTTEGNKTSTTLAPTSSEKIEQGACDALSSQPCSCATTGCNYNKATSKCTEEMQECSSDLSCVHPQTVVAHDGVLCFNNRSSPCPAEPVVAVNLNGKNHSSANGFHYISDKHLNRTDPHKIIRLSSAKSQCEQIGNLLHEQDKRLYETYVHARTRNLPQGHTWRDTCVTYHVKIKQEGFHELTLLLADPHHEDMGKRLFHVTLNGLLVAENIDINAISGGRCMAAEVAIPFQAKARMKLKVGFCVSDCRSAKDNTFKVAAFSIVRFKTSASLPSTVPEENETFT